MEGEEYPSIGSCLLRFLEVNTQFLAQLSMFSHYVSLFRN